MLIEGTPKARPLQPFYTDVRCHRALFDTDQIVRRASLSRLIPGAFGYHFLEGNYTSTTRMSLPISAMWPISTPRIRGRSLAAAQRRGPSNGSCVLTNCPTRSTSICPIACGKSLRSSSMLMPMMSPSRRARAPD